MMQILFGREDVTAKIMEYIEKETYSQPVNPNQDSQNTAKSRWKSLATKIDDDLLSDFTRLSMNYSRDSTPLLIISGSAGTGKSSLLAYCAKNALENPDFEVVYHFVGASNGSTSLYGVLSRSVYKNSLPNITSL